MRTPADAQRVQQEADRLVAASTAFATIVRLPSQLSATERRALVALLRKLDEPREAKPVDPASMIG